MLSFSSEFAQLFLGALIVLGKALMVLRLLEWDWTFVPQNFTPALAGLFNLKPPKCVLSGTWSWVEVVTAVNTWVIFTFSLLFSLWYSLLKASLPNLEGYKLTKTLNPPIVNYEKFLVNCERKNFLPVGGNTTPLCTISSHLVNRFNLQPRFFFLVYFCRFLKHIKRTWLLHVQICSVGVPLLQPSLGRGCSHPSPPDCCIDAACSGLPLEPISPQIPGSCNASQECFCRRPWGTSALHHFKLIQKTTDSCQALCQVVWTIFALWFKDTNQVIKLLG